MPGPIKNVYSAAQAERFPWTEVERLAATLASRGCQATGPLLRHNGVAGSVAGDGRRAQALSPSTRRQKSYGIGTD